MFAQRYELVRQRMLRQDIFQPKLLTNANAGGGGRSSTSRGGDEDDHDGGGETHHILTPVESLLGRGGVRYLLGMIVQVRGDR
jgi:hypothetical protein